MRLGLLSTANINRAILAGASATERVEVVAVASRFSSHPVVLAGGVFQNRVLVVLRWTVSFLTHGRGARLIGEAGEAPATNER